MRAVSLCVLVLIAAACGTLEPAAVAPTDAASTTLWNDAANPGETSDTVVISPTTSTLAFADSTTTSTTTTTSVPPTEPFTADLAAQALQDAVRAYGVVLQQWFDQQVIEADVVAFLDLYDETRFATDPAEFVAEFVGCYQSSYPSPDLTDGRPIEFTAVVTGQAEVAPEVWQLAFNLQMNLNGSLTTEQNSIVLSASGLAPDETWGMQTDCPGILTPQ